MGRKSQERMTGYTHEERVALGGRRAKIYLQRVTQAIMDRIRGKVAIEPKRPSRKEVG